MMYPTKPITSKQLALINRLSKERMSNKQRRSFFLMVSIGNSHTIDCVRSITSNQAHHIIQFLMTLPIRSFDDDEGFIPKDIVYHPGDAW